MKTAAGLHTPMGLGFLVLSYVNNAIWYCSVQTALRTLGCRQTHLRII